MRLAPSVMLFVAASCGAPPPAPEPPSSSPADPIGRLEVLGIVASPDPLILDAGFSLRLDETNRRVIEAARAADAPILVTYRDRPEGVVVWSSP